MTTRNDIKEWLRRGKASGQKWLIVVCDTFDYDDYPVYAKDDKEFNEKYERHNGKNMQRIMETYNIEIAWKKQLDKERSHSRP